MSFIKKLQTYSPTFLLDFNTKFTGSIRNLGSVAVTHEFVGNATPVQLTTTITPSRGHFGGGMHFVANSADTEAGSSGYRVLTTNNQNYKPTSAVTILIACNKQTFKRYGSYISCTQTGGWNIECQLEGTSLYINAVFYVNGSYLRAISPKPFELNTNSNLLIGTYDGRYAKLYHNGVLIGIGDAGANYPIGYSSNTVHIGIGFEPGLNTNISNFIGLPVEIAAMIPNVALTQAQINELYTEFSTVRTMSGNLTQTDLNIGKLVRIRPWHDDNDTKDEVFNQSLDIVPASNGDWSINLPDGNYEVVFIGDSNFAPVIHGPVKPG